MKITIDEVIIQSRIQLTIWEEGCASKLDNSPKAVEALIEIVKKYQKIEQIISDGYLQGKSSGEMLLGIKEVMNRNDN